MSKSNRYIIILAVILFAVLIAAYANHFNNGFHFDDSHTLIDNVHIRNIKNIPAFFSDPKMFSADPSHWTLRPVVTTSLAIDYWLGGGLYPFYFQLSTFIWFIWLGILLFFLYKNLLNRSIEHEWGNYMALAATAWYVLHTANAETINYIIARSDVLSTLCIVSSLSLYISYPDKRKWLLYAIPAFIGVFAKETVSALVVILFFYILLFEHNLSVADLFKARNLKIIFHTILKVLPLFVIVLAAQLYTILKAAGIPGASNPLFYYLLTQAYVWLHYFISFFFPLNLSADTDWTVIYNVFDERIITGLIFITILIVTIFKTSVKKNTKPIAFGLIWFSAALLPTSIAPLAEVTNDHRMFFPFIGLALSVVTFIGLWLIKMEKRINAHQKYKILIGACILLVLGLNAYGVHQRNKVWKNEESLWRDVTVQSPLNGRGLMNYGLTQMAKGNYNTADYYYAKAEQLLPYYNTLYINIGILKGATNHPEEADENFKKAIAYSPNTFDSYAYYARYLQQVKRFNQARQMAEKALQLNPYSVMALNVLMNVYNELGLWDNLQRTAKKTLTILPNDTTAKSFLATAKKHINY
ncbi:MAG: tetratricopeptide repeat protein [Mucilaginibacter sp.]|nr:tetratricopeptide repeat protein [Mucilaginibacter sp.]